MCNFFKDYMLHFSISNCTYICTYVRYIKFLLRKRFIPKKFKFLSGFLNRNRFKVYPFCTPLSAPPLPLRLTRTYGNLFVNFHPFVRQQIGIPSKRNELQIML